VLTGSVVSFFRDRTLAVDFFHEPQCENKFSLINPWLRCEPQENFLEKKEWSSFKEALLKDIDIWKTIGKVDRTAVYFRDLQFGPWMGINEQDIFAGASLLKVPLMFAVLRYADTHPETLSQEVLVSSELQSDFSQDYPSRKSVQVGQSYTIDELLHFMIVYSDNTAKNALDAYLDSASPSEPLLLVTLEELGFIDRLHFNDGNLRVKQVASLFRLLYNGSYLSKDMSQKALSLLRESDFHQGIVGGVPSELEVAHKFGEREFSDGQKQLHDCGVVYHPKNHYLLCIMTRGRDMKDLSEVIRTISAKVYAEMEVRTKE
jgi:beta-lactamase class A